MGSIIDTIFSFISAFCIIAGIGLGIAMIVTGNQNVNKDKLKHEQVSAVFSISTYLIVTGLVWPIFQILDHIRG